MTHVLVQWEHDEHSFNHLDDMITKKDFASSDTEVAPCYAHSGSGCPWSPDSGSSSPPLCVGTDRTDQIQLETEQKSLLLE